MQIQVLDDSSWEIDKIKFDSFEWLNQKISENLKTFSDFYVKRHTAHRVKWVFGHMTAEVQIQKLNKPYLLTCNLIQLSILQLLEKKGPLSIKIISDYLSFDTKQTLHEVQFLWASPNFNLKKQVNIGLIIPEDHQNEKDLTENIIMKINSNFTHNNLRINSVPSAPPKVKTRIKIKIKITIKIKIKYIRINI
jgi:hypothetical protein